jgi:hypothetical protein
MKSKMRYIITYKRDSNTITKTIELKGDGSTKPVIIKWVVGSDKIKICQDGICIKINRSQLKEINKFYHEFLFNFLNEENNG